MPGQGRPPIQLRKAFFELMATLRSRGARVACCAILFLIAMVPIEMLCAQRMYPSEPYRIRVTWGGGHVISWQGQISLLRGEVKELTPLGLSFDAGGTSFVANQKAFIRSIRPADFAGVDLELICDAHDELLVELFDADAPHGRFEKTIPMSQIVSGRFQMEIDGTGNRIEITRAPGDPLRVSFERPHLVFEPGELFSFRASANQSGFPASSKVRLNVQVIPARTSREIWSSQWQFRTGEGGRFETDQDIQIPMPKDEGAYDIVLKLISAARTGPFTWNQQVLERRFQAVVVDPRPQGGRKVQLWQNTAVVNPAEDEWKQRFSDLTHLRFKEMVVGPLKNDEATTVDWNDNKVLQLDPGGWQAIPLPINEPGKPHLIEIEYVDEGPISLGISLLQPDGTGQIPYFGADSGIHIPEHVANVNQPKWRRHRMFVWPHHESPFLLFANRHSTRSVKIGQILIQSGPTQLGSLTPPRPPGQNNARSYMAFYEKPLFTENFSVVKTIDPGTRQLVDDWTSFLEGANRWTEYLKANGYTGAMLVVAGDGSSLYPSASIQPTPRFDNGVFSSAGLDPVRKDVVEMLLRVFQRQGLTLVPVIHFNSALVELEQQRLAGDPTGIDLVDINGNRRRRAYIEAHQPISLYNPLDSRVQSALRRVTDELVHRYGQHQAFGGLGLLYSQDAINLLPGQTWGLDAKTIERFLSQSPELSHLQTDQPKFLYRLLSGVERNSLLKWRARQNDLWLSSVRQDLQRVKPEAKVFVLGTDLFQSQDAFSAVAPSLRRKGDLVEAASRIALPIETIRKHEDVVFLRPYEIGPEYSLNAKRASLQNNLSQQANELFGSQSAGFLFSHRYWWAHFSQLEEHKPFGTAQSAIMRMQPLVPGEFWNRQRLANAFLESDCTYLVEGGVFASFGQEGQLGNWIESFTQMPAAPFQDVKPDSATEMPNGVVVRQVVSGGQWYFYVVNTSPWSTQVQLQVQSSSSEIQALSNQVFNIEDGQQNRVLSFELEPFDIALGRSLQIATILKVETAYQHDLAAALRTELETLMSKKSKAEQADPLDVLVNPGFEPVPDSPPLDGSASINPFGWYYDPQLETNIRRIKDSPHQGTMALSLTSQGPNEITWIRSNVIPTPETGRLSVVVWLRTRDVDMQPPLRISVQGDIGRDIYYRYGTVGDQNGNPIVAEWKPFAVHFDDLPPGGVNNLKIGFDLMGTGYVEIDQVQVFDRWLDDHDAAAMKQTLQLASFQLTNHRNYDQCRRILEGYWPQFLNAYFRQDDSISPESQVTEEGSDSAKPRTSLLQKILPKF